MLFSGSTIKMLTEKCMGEDCTEPVYGVIHSYDELSRKINYTTLCFREYYEVANNIQIKINGNQIEVKEEN